MPGIFYHVGDIEGGENLIECRQIVDENMHAVAHSAVHSHVLVLLGSHSLRLTTVNLPFKQVCNFLTKHVHVH